MVAVFHVVCGGGWGGVICGFNLIAEQHVCGKFMYGSELFGYVIDLINSHP